MNERIYEEHSRNGVLLIFGYHYIGCMVFRDIYSNNDTIFDPCAVRGTGISFILLGRISYVEKLNDNRKEGCINGEY